MCTRISARAPRRLHTYTNPREKPKPPPISRRSARAPPPVNKLSRFIPFFHRRSRYIFPVRPPGILRTPRTLAQVTEKFAPPACQPRPRSQLSIIGRLFVRKHSEFSQTEFPFCDIEKSDVDETSPSDSLAKEKERMNDFSATSNSRTFATDESRAYENELLKGRDGRKASARARKRCPFAGVFLTRRYVYASLSRYRCVIFSIARRYPRVKEEKV